MATSLKRPFEIITVDDSDASSDEPSPARPAKIARTVTTDDDLTLNPHVLDIMDAWQDLTPPGAETTDQDSNQPIEDDAGEATSPATLSSGISSPVNLPPDGFRYAPQPDPDLLVEPVLTEDECFKRLLDVFPDVAHDHALTLVRDKSNMISAVIDHLMQSSEYPKEKERQAALQREKEAAEAAEKQLFSVTPEGPVAGRKAILDILKAEFPKIPVHFITATQKEERTLYKAYLALNAAQHADRPPYGRCPWRPTSDVNFEALSIRHGYAFGDDKVIQDLRKQYEAAKKTCDESNAQRRKEAAAKKREQENEDEAKAAGTISECGVCFGESPLNRMIQCNQEPHHLTCFECAATYIETEVGQARCKLSCPDCSGCDGTFTEAQLRLLVHVPANLLDRLFQLQQEQAIRDAGIDDIESCPFCDYKTVCPPIDVDFEFRCQGLDCKITSCRKCKQRSHIPDTCDEAKRKRSKDAALDLRRAIEEEMSKALIRTCNNPKCRKPFIKIEGCNKMTCPSCGHHQCYVCGESIQGYEHFKKGCPQSDDVNVRHAQEVKAAEEAARAKVIAANPDVAKEHLEIKVSETVQQAENAPPPQLPPLNANRRYGMVDPLAQMRDAVQRQEELIRQQARLDRLYIDRENMRQQRERAREQVAQLQREQLQRQQALRHALRQDRENNAQPALQTRPPRRGFAEIANNLMRFGGRPTLPGGHQNNLPTLGAAALQGHNAQTNDVPRGRFNIDRQIHANANDQFGFFLPIGAMPNHIPGQQQAQQAAPQGLPQPGWPMLQEPPQQAANYTADQALINQHVQQPLEPQFILQPMYEEFRFGGNFVPRRD